MTEFQRLFLVQARSGFVVFEVLKSSADIHHCHALHYLQMATELLGKAHGWKDGFQKKIHRAFVKFLKELRTDRNAQRQMGFEEKNEKWSQLIRQAVPLAKRIEDLAPSLAGDRPNPEYPWPPNEPAHTPVEHEFDVWRDLRTPVGRQFLAFLHKLFESAGAFL